MIFLIFLLFLNLPEKFGYPFPVYIDHLHRLFVFGGGDLLGFEVELDDNLVVDTYAAGVEGHYIIEPAPVEPLVLVFFILLLLEFIKTLLVGLQIPEMNNSCGVALANGDHCGVALLAEFVYMEVRDAYYRQKEDETNDNRLYQTADGQSLPPLPQVSIEWDDDRQHQQ